MFLQSKVRKGKVAPILFVALYLVLGVALSTTRLSFGEGLIATLAYVVGCVTVFHAARWVLTLLREASDPVGALFSGGFGFVLSGLMTLAATPLDFCTAALVATAVGLLCFYVSCTTYHDEEKELSS